LVQACALALATALADGVRKRTHIANPDERELDHRLETAIAGRAGTPAKLGVPRSLYRRAIAQLERHAKRKQAKVATTAQEA
jgi:hypothetical protein